MKVIKDIIQSPSSISRRVVIRGLKAGIALGLFGLLIYFTLRSESSFKSIAWIPNGITTFLEEYIYLRNFWGFLPLGIFIGWAYGVGPGLWKDGRVRWVVVGLLLLPVVKELVQIPLPNRHCHPLGILAGVAGMWLGLGICAVFRLKKKEGLRGNLEGEKNH